MKSRQLGPFTVSALGLGCMSMSYGYNKPDPKEAERTLRNAIDMGYTMLDTAAFYGFGSNEELIGRVLKDRRQDYVLASKGGLFKNDEGKRAVDGHPEALKRNCEDSLRRLGTDVIDVYYLHRVDPKVPIEDSIGALSQLVEEGKVQTIGVSEVSSKNLRKAHQIHPLTAVQSEYSLWTRNPEQHVLPACKELGINFVAFSPLARGFFTGRVTSTEGFDAQDLRLTMPRFLGENFTANLQLLDEYTTIAEENYCTGAQLALAWLLAQHESIIPIPGTQHSAYAEENAAAAEVELSTETVARLNALINESTVAGERYNAQVMKTMDSEFE